MTNETARREIESLDYYLQNRTDDYSEESHTAMMMAVKALEQKDMLKKIREEIEALSNANPSYTHTCDVVDREDVLDIIDKYRKGDVE